MDLTTKLVTLGVVLCVALLSHQSAADENTIKCGQALDCESCVDMKECYYCAEPEGINPKCQAFADSGINSAFPDTDRCPLNEVNWLQCTLDYQALVIIVAVVGVIILAMLGCCCYCCCCK